MTDKFCEITTILAEKFLKYKVTKGLSLCSKNHSCKFTGATIMNTDFANGYGIQVFLHLFGDLQNNSSVVNSKDSNKQLCRTSRNRPGLRKCLLFSEKLN